MLSATALPYPVDHLREASRLLEDAEAAIEREYYAALPDERPGLAIERSAVRHVRERMDTLRAQRRAQDGPAWARLLRTARSVSDA